jgi:TolB-like protein/class 3 adenylate cyclase/tetratricopeptide (TPR) repeat protein
LSDGPRRLAAIAFTDIVGYTSLAQRNESLAIQLLDRHNALLRSLLKQHQGREVKTIGDAFLLEFDSALDAVLYSIEIQAVLKEQNRFAQQDEQIHVRIGIHVGDVIHRDGDVLGDAVNIASRVVNFADQGGICISEQVYAQVRNKVQNAMVKIPEQQLKNVEQQVGLYHVLLPWSASGPSKSSTKSIRVAILPFANISPDPGDGFFADGLTEELISTLSEVKGLRVIARTSVNLYKGSSKGISQIGNELQVAFILEGSVRKVGNKIRVTAQLIEVNSQEHVWSNHYDRDLDEVFSIQSDIARRVAESTKVTLLTGESARIEMRQTEDPTAYVAYLKGRTLLHDRSERAIKGAKEQFELAIREDSGYAKAYSGLADAHMLLGDYQFSPLPASLEEAKAYIDKALALDPDLAEARASSGNYLFFEYKFAEAEQELSRAIALNPSYATGHHWYGMCLSALGELQEAYREVKLAEELDPLSSAIALSALYRSIWAGEYDEALKRVRKIAEIDPESPLVNEALMVYHFGRRDWENALLYLRKLIDADPSDPYLDMDLAYIYAVTGKREEALKLVEKLKATPETMRLKGGLLAFVYAGLGDLDECFRWLEYAAASREGFFGWFRSNPMLGDVQRDPRFAQLLKKVTLPP